MVGACTGNVRSTPTPKLTFRTVESLLETRTLAADDDALEHLDALTGTLDHAHVDLRVSPGAKCGNVVAKRVAVDEVGGIHVSGPFRITEALEV